MENKSVYVLTDLSFGAIAIFSSPEEAKPFIKDMKEKWNERYGRGKEYDYIEGEDYTLERMEINPDPQDFWNKNKYWHKSDWVHLDID